MITAAIACHRIIATGDIPGSLQPVEAWLSRATKYRNEDDFLNAVLGLLTAGPRAVTEPTADAAFRIIESYFFKRTENVTFTTRGAQVLADQFMKTLATARTIPSGPRMTYIRRAVLLSNSSLPYSGMYFSVIRILQMILERRDAHSGREAVECWLLLREITTGIRPQAVYRALMSKLATRDFGFFIDAVLGFAYKHHHIPRTERFWADPFVQQFLQADVRHEVLATQRAPLMQRQTAGDPTNHARQIPSADPTSPAVLPAGAFVENASQATIDV